MANMRVAYLPANAAWAVIWGNNLLRLAPDLPVFWNRKRDLVEAVGQYWKADVLKGGVIRRRESEAGE